MTKNFFSYLLAIAIGIVSSLLATKLSNNSQITDITILVSITSISCCALFLACKYLIDSFGFFYGITIIKNIPSVYITDISVNLSQCKKYMFLKVFTGHEFFTNKSIRESIDIALGGSSKKEIAVIFSNPTSNSYENETKSTKELLVRKHETALGYIKIIEEKLQASIDRRYISEKLNLLNFIVIDDSMAYLFIRNFERIDGYGNQFIVRVNLKKSNTIFVNAIFNLKDYFLKYSEHMVSM